MYPTRVAASFCLTDPGRTRELSVDVFSDDQRSVVTGQSTPHSTEYRVIVGVYTPFAFRFHLVTSRCRHPTRDEFVEILAFGKIVSTVQPRCRHRSQTYEQQHPQPHHHDGGHPQHPDHDLVERHPFGLEISEWSCCGPFRTAEHPTTRRRRFRSRFDPSECIVSGPSSRRGTARRLGYFDRRRTRNRSRSRIRSGSRTESREGIRCELSFIRNSKGTD